MARHKDRHFELVTPFQPTGDQPQAIARLVEEIRAGRHQQALLGVTGSGKTFTMANVIATLNKPALVLCHNKTLAAQLFSEFREFFPRNAVEYFVSYYDYYQPEAYIPSTDTFIEKDSQINDEIDKLRHSATRSLFERNDVIIVSSVSCIYGLGSPEEYQSLNITLDVGQELSRQDLLKSLVEIQYKRNDVDFHRGTFRVRGDVVEVFPAYEEETAIRIEFFGDEVESISAVDPLRGTRLYSLNWVTLYPGSHYVTTRERRNHALVTIREELDERLNELKTLGKLVELQRLEQRTRFDLEMIEELGFCQGIENYSRHLTGRRPGEPPPTLLEYIPRDYLLFIDESHVTVPQIGGMYRGDRARKMTLVEHGFRLPSALDNRPLNFDEFKKWQGHTVYVSATPGDYELTVTGGEVVEQVIRPTGLLDPQVEIRPAGQQVDDLLQEIPRHVQRGFRVLVTTLTKKLAEELSRYYEQKGMRVKYLHSDVDTLERIEILRDLRLGHFDVLIGINLLREGLDLPEVSLVAILDADKEGFLRSYRSLIQTIGRAARNSEGRVILYADKMTESMRKAIEETERRRKIQEAYNLKHGIIPKTIEKAVHAPMTSQNPDARPDDQDDSVKDEKVIRGRRGFQKERAALAKRALGTGQGSTQSRSLWAATDSQGAVQADFLDPLDRAEQIQQVAGDYFTSVDELEKILKKMSDEMRKAAQSLDFEKAAELRDRIKLLKSLRLGL